MPDLARGRDTSDAGTIGFVIGVAWSVGLSMSRVEIHGADGRQVVVDHDGDLSYVKEKALEIWEATRESSRAAGPAYGFSVERRSTYDVSPTGNGGGRSSPDPVAARSEVFGFAGPAPQDR